MRVSAFTFKSAAGTPLARAVRRVEEVYEQQAPRLGLGRRVRGDAKCAGLLAEVAGSWALGVPDWCRESRVRLKRVTLCGQPN